MQIAWSIIASAVLVAAIPPDCPPPPPFNATACDLSAPSNATSPCKSGETCVPASADTPDVGVCAGRFCEGFATGESMNCFPCPETQICTFNFTFLPEFPAYCALKSYPCAGPDSLACPSNGQSWACVAPHNSQCGNPSSTCIGYCRPA